jgi:hypothetical protein
MQKTTKMGLMLLSAAVLGLAAPVVRADTPAVSFTTVENEGTNGSYSMGYEFTVNSNIDATALGFFGTQLSESHDVGIYDLSGNLLTSTTVNPGDPVTGFFSYHSITPFALSSGSSYVIAAVTGNENYSWDPSGFSTDPSVSFDQDLYAPSSTLIFPFNSEGLTGFFGPNFLIGSGTTGGGGGGGGNGVPEPGTLALLAGMGLCSVPFLRRRRRA